MPVRYCHACFSGELSTGKEVTAPPSLNLSVTLIFRRRVVVRWGDLGEA